MASLFGRRLFVLLPHRFRSYTLTKSCNSDFMAEVKTLRNKTGAGISLCIEALKNNDNNHEKAIKYIVEKCNQNNDENAQHNTDITPGLVGITINAQNNFAVISKLSCQTDFVAKTEEFSKTMSEIMEMAARDIHKNYEFRPLEKVSFDYNELKNTQHIMKGSNNGINTIGKKLNLLSAQVAEKLTIENIIAITIPENHYLGYYCHWIGPNIIGTVPFQFTYGRIGALAVVCKDIIPTSISEEFIRTRAREVAIHVVGMRPTSMELSDTSTVNKAMSEDSYNNELVDTPDLDSHVGGALLDQPFFFRRSLKVRLWALRNKLQIVDFICME